MDKCIKRICGWTGTDEQKKKVFNEKLTNGNIRIFDLVCPNCGCRSFHEVGDSSKLSGPKKQRGLIDIDITVVIALLVVGIIAMVYFGKRDSERWQEFLKNNNCKIVSKIDGDVISTTTVDSRGNPSTSIGVTQDKTGWKCDDGVTYYR